MSVNPVSVGTASRFLGGLGVNVHLDYGDTAYAHAQAVLDDVAYLGFGHVRDHTPALDAAGLAPYALLAAHGIAFDLDAPSGTVDLGGFVARLDGFAARLPGALAAVEGSNEVNLWPVGYAGLTGLAAAAALQRALYAAVKGDSHLAGIPVYATTLGGGSQAQYAQLGNLSGAADFGNAHVYPQGSLSPGAYMAAELAWETPDTPGKPSVVTEGGYFTMPGVAAWEGVSQDVQARYTLDYVMDAAAQGVAATYLYELLDERPDPGNTDREQHFGLFNNDGSPKPVARALHALTSILADPNDPAATATGIAATAATLPAGAHTLQLAKASGARDIVVWAEPTLWNQATASAQAAPGTTVTLDLGAVRQSVQVFDPLLGTTPIARLSSVGAVTLAVTDHPLVVEVAPDAAVPDTLSLRLSEDAWQGDAQFTVSVDGTQVGGVRAVSALHAGGASQVVSLDGPWGGGAHRVAVAFINDAYGGSPATDRNLYVDSVAYDGTTYAGTAATLDSNATATCSVGAGAAAAAAPPDMLTLHLSEDAWQGDARFTVSVDGRQLDTATAVTTLHGSGQMQDFSFAAALGAGAHTVGVSFVNDAYGGTAATDRNLYVGGIDINGSHVGSGMAALWSNGSQQYGIQTAA